MTSRLDRFLFRSARGRRTRAGIVLAAVIAVPLVVAGLVAAAFGGADEGIERIPALVVNNDEMVVQTGADGQEQTILAGRLLVTELTGGEGAGFDWSLSNDEEAADALAGGRAYAVLTIPEGFSASVASLGGRSPERAGLALRTDDAHAYLAGSAAQSVGEAMTATLGRGLTEQVLAGFTTGLSELASGVGEAAGGSAALADGAGTLAGGLDDLAAGAGDAADGAREAADGTAAYVAGVRGYADGVDGLAAGLGELRTGAAGLDEIASGVREYTGVVSGLSERVGGAAGELRALAAAHPELLEQIPELGEALGAVSELEGGVAEFAAGGEELAAGTETAIAGVQAGIDDAAGGAAALADGSERLRTGGDGLAAGAGALADGLGELSAGAAASASGAHELGMGAGRLATGLGDAARQSEPFAGMDAERTAAVVADPVGVTTERANEIAGIPEVIGVLIVPVGLWLGALALFLVFRPLGREALGSTAPTGRLVARTLVRGGAVALAQATAVTLLLHTALGVPWSLTAQTFAFSALAALAFTALNAFLTIWLGRSGLVVSLVLVALQLTATGGLVPIEAVSAPIRALAPFLPIGWGVQGMQAIVSGAGGAAVAEAAAVLAVFAVAAVAGMLVAVSARRGIRAQAMVRAVA
ncbi:YhgE/Pip family protein [Agromyces archimandritae]|uniref:YhgE/Pip family protein n=1 Tax=Agromyces archimandritae TaxID=2781962 RepID=A0A975FLK1_9MICO|nr:YhgE/Pip family protein [Agromyces archimandritae]QTX04344.1 YhgE/Pip family protein [Agromyces archimandritae]